MIFAIPILVEERSSGLRPPVFTVRPLFQSEPVQRAEKLSRALTKLTNDLHQLIHHLGHDPRHDALAEWTFHPPFEETTLPLRLELSSGSELRNFFFAGYTALGRKLYFTPALPELHFELLPGQSLSERATAVLTRHFRDLEKSEGELDLDEYAVNGRARLTTIEIALNPAALAKKPRKPARALIFGGEEKKDGEVELRRTGRALHSQYPDDLDRAVGREREVEELARLFAAADRRPILLVGPRKVGKTTIVQELVWQTCARKKERFGGGREVWLVSPMRLISGMSYLGEWENRVLAILDHARARDKVLYFDDLLGLFTAGMSAASDLNVAQVLKPALEKHHVRVLAEITPESWRVLRERDRAFADLFHVIPIHEPPEPETLRVLVSVTRQLETQHRCEFELSVVPTVCDLHRRLERDAAFPGKAAGSLRRLAVRFAGARIGRDQALDEFHNRSGLDLAFLDHGMALSRRLIVDGLRARVVGQDHAMEAFADILVTLKARLNDPGRPLGTLLLLGPTGVGKTQSAKALAEYLFGSSERLLRFDMNEYVDGNSATRLTGTLCEPEGLLTSAIRRRPFSVVLFDEIEKAAPEVFDLLLAVLDEARLADALGRVADFTQAVILLTSNLGAREARARLGFTAGAASVEADDAVYVGAAEKFFRPEFFNRLDRIVPFRVLKPEQLEGIARQLIDGVFAREGLRQRQCLLNVAPAAMARLVELGHHPQLGARSLKRVIEREIAQPLAEKLAALPPGTPTIADFSAEADRFVLQLQELRPVARSAFWTEAVAQTRTEAARPDWTEGLLEGACAALDRMDAELEATAPTGTIELSSLAPEHARYFCCREQLKKVERLAHAVERARQAPRKPAASAPAHRPKVRPTKLVLRQFISGTPRFYRRREAIALRLELADLEAADAVEWPDSPFTALLRELALLEAMTAKPFEDSPAMMVFRGLNNADTEYVLELARRWHDFFGHLWGGSATFLFPNPGREELLLKPVFGEARSTPFQALFLKGPNLRKFLPVAGRTVLVRRADGSLGVLLLEVRDVESPAEAETLARSFAPPAAASQASAVHSETENVGAVVQMLEVNERLTDFRSGFVIPAEPSPEEFRALVLSALPLPQEVEP